MNKFKYAPDVKVGILTTADIRIDLNGLFKDEKNGLSISGIITLSADNDEIRLTGENGKSGSYPQLHLKPAILKSSFKVFDVTIGIGFHWQKNEDQVFSGSLMVIPGTTGITLINILPVENYLVSVISSEMRATSSPEMLKAHAVISRSWLLAQIEKGSELRKSENPYQSAFVSDEEIIRWYDREDHAEFDVCADDHCQRYQGITRAFNDAASDAVNQTAGEVLIHDNVLCDARFSKCCGGITEKFENVWEPLIHPYLQRVYDNEDHLSDLSGDLTDEEDARAWIMSSPPAFCNTTDKRILSQVLNDYDQKTHDFYRWAISYSAEELSDLIKSKTGIDFGIIHDMVPVERGVSGRLKKLRITGTNKSMIIGKELEIRKALSPAHLYSSAFIVEKVRKGDDEIFNLYGAGWGHGVGLCQIGAAVMGAKGYGYKEILLHYFRGADIKRLY